VYASYCANQVFAKSVLDAKKQGAQIGDFLERCLESPFSRHLDLWNFLGNSWQFVDQTYWLHYVLAVVAVQQSDVSCCAAVGCAVGCQY